jgi:hypothetical protein
MTEQRINVLFDRLLETQGHIQALQVLLIALATTHTDTPGALNLARRIADATRDQWLAQPVEDLLIDSFDAHMNVLLGALESRPPR